MTYIDGFVAAVATDSKESYRAHARKALEGFKRHGALSGFECWGDDVPDGEITSFPMAVKKKDDETVVFSWITWPDKTTRDAGMKTMLEDPEMNMDPSSMPFDGKRLIYGGFEMIVEV